MYHHHNLIRIDKIKGVLSKATVIFKLKVADSFKVADLLLTHGRSGINPHWQITENSSRNFSEIIIFRVVRQAVWEFVKYYFRLNAFFWMSFPVKLSSSRPCLKNGIGTHDFLMDEFSSKSFTVKRSQKCPRNLPIRVKSITFVLTGHRSLSTWQWPIKTIPSKKLN